MDSANILAGNQFNVTMLESFIIYQCSWMEIFKLMVQKHKCQMISENENGTAISSTNNNKMNSTNNLLTSHGANRTLLESYINGACALMERLKTMVPITKDHENPSGSIVKSVETSAETRSHHNIVNINDTGTDDFGAMNNVLTTNAENLADVPAIQRKENSDQNHEIIESLGLVEDNDDKAGAEYETESETVADKENARFNSDICDESFHTKIGVIENMEDQRKQGLVHYNKHFEVLKELSIPLVRHRRFKPSPCQVCGKVFSQISTMKRHLKIHTGERPFSCKTCGRRFLHNNYLTRHLRTHTGEKPFPCKICEKRYARKDNLKVHLRTHTGEQLF